MACILDIKQDIVDDISDRLKKQGAIINDNTGYFDNNKESSKIINDINKTFDELVIKEGDQNSFFIEPSQNLIDRYFKSYRDDINNFKNKIIKLSEEDRINNETNLGINSEGDSIYLQKSNNSQQTNEELTRKINSFLGTNGVNVKYLDELKDSLGNPIDAVAKANILNKTIEILAGREDITTLPEEAAHFYVKMIEGTPLYNQMMKSITGYKMYGDVINEYKDNKLYRNQDSTINFDKIKEEAIGKLITNYIIKDYIGNESESKMFEAKKWWAKLWDLLLNVFKNTESNPFQQVSESILNNQTKGLKKIEDNNSEEFYQLSNKKNISPETIFNSIIKDQQRIQLDDSIDPKTGEKKHIYSIDGKNVVDKNGIPRSVSSVEVNKFYKDKFKIDKRTTVQKEIDNVKAEVGTELHDLIRSKIDIKLNKDTRQIEDITKNENGDFNKPINELLDSFLDKLFESYPKDSKFLTEVKVYDSVKNIAGSIDLVVIQPDGTCDIYDWKSQEVKPGEDELKWFKEPAYRIQLDAYKRILQQEYGITKFGKIRAIPIATKFNVKRENDIWMPIGLRGIEIGAFNPSNTPEDKSYLLPVLSLQESTGDIGLDKLIKQLQGIYDLTSSRKDFETKQIKAAELNKIKKAIKDLQIKNNIASFTDSGFTEISKYNTKVANNSLTKSDILGSEDILKVYSESQELLEDKLVDLNNLIDITKEGAEKTRLIKIQSDFLRMSGNARSVLNRMNEKKKELGIEIAQQNGIMNLLTSEKKMDVLKTMFRSLSTLPTKAIQTFYQVLSQSQGKRDNEIHKINHKLGELRTNMLEWSKSKGLSINNMFDSILKFKDNQWTGDFIDKYNKEFRVKKEEAIQTNNLKWIQDNTIFNDIKYEEGLNKYKEYLTNNPYSIDEKTNTERIDRALQKYSDEYDIRVSKFAYTNNNNYFLTPKDEWLSKEWNDLYKKDNSGNYINKPLVEAFEYFQELKKKSDSLGMVEFDTHMIPSVRQDKIELLTFNGFQNIFNAQGLFENLQTNSDKSYGEINPITGELIKRIPVAFVNNLGVQKEDGTVDYMNKSKDLFKVFSVWGAHTANYEAMSSIKDIADILVDVERGKKHLETNTFGKVTKNKTELPGNEDNAKILDNFVKYYVYGQKISEGSDYAFKVGDKEYSVVKSGRALLSFLSIKTLGLNTLSGTSTFVGGTGNAFFQAQKGQFFNTSDWSNALRLFTSRDPKTMALIHKSLGLEDEKRKDSNDLSVSGVVKEFTLDKLMFIQKYGDLGVQYPVAIAMYNNHMLLNGKIVDINQYVKEQNSYFDNFYNLSKDEQKLMVAKIDKEVGELKKSSSLYNISKIENNRLIIPGMEFDNPEMIKFVNKIKKINKSIIGNATHEDINQFRMTLLGQVCMQFRSWMPQMITERFGDMNYDTDLGTYEYGKARLFFKHLYKAKIFPLIGELITGFSSNTIDVAKARYIEFTDRMLSEGREFNISETEFIDQYLGNLRSAVGELVILSAFMSLMFWVKGGTDDDKTGIRKYLARATNKYQNEFSFYYSPSEFTQLLKSPVPMMGLLNDFQSFGTQTMGQLYGFSTQDDKMMQKNHPMMILGRIMPITKEAESIYALFDDDFRKDWGLRNK